MQKDWKRPEIVVLLRGTPEDGTNQTITGCKNIALRKNDPDNAAQTACLFEHGSRAGVLCYDNTLS